MNSLGRILLVEDDPNDVELTLTALDEYNLANEVVVARDGEEALDYLYYGGDFMRRAGENPAVLLLDLKLPKVDGLEVLQQIKSDEKLKMIPVVVLTSSREEKDMTLVEAERNHILKALEESNWVVGGKSGAAARLGVKRTTLIDKMRKRGLSREMAAGL